MAWYTVEYKCGHTEEKQLYGKSTDRQSKIDWYKTIDCPECRAKQATDLNGSTKQVAWAADIRKDIMTEVKQRYAALKKANDQWNDELEDRFKILLECVDYVIAAHKDARWWIESANTAGIEMEAEKEFARRAEAK